jgi:hypothetical protein
VYGLTAKQILIRTLLFLLLMLVFMIIAMILTAVVMWRMGMYDA